MPSLIALSEDKKKSKLNNDQKLIEAVSWLAAWYESSWSMDEKYRNVVWVERHLSKLKSVVPFNDTPRALYRVIGRDKELSVGQTVDLKGKELTSYTLLSKPKDLSALYDQVG